MKTKLLLFLMSTILFLFGISIYSITVLFLGSFFPTIDLSILRYPLVILLSLTPIPYLLKGESIFFQIQRFFGILICVILLNMILVFLPYYFINMDFSQKLLEEGTVVGPAGTGDIMAWATLLMIEGLILFFNIIFLMAMQLYKKMKN